MADQVPLEEYAELEINGETFRDWQTVLVHDEYGGAPRMFQFTSTEAVSEQGLTAPTWGKLQIKPGDTCVVRLAGEIAVTGYVNLRQAAYDPESHGVMLAGRGRTSDLIDSSIMIKGGQFRGYTWGAIARRVLQPYGINLKTIGSGSDSERPFDKDAQVNPGESPFTFLDRLARMRGIVLGESESGDLTALAQLQQGASGDDLVEGLNILRANCVVRDDYMLDPLMMLGQVTGSDQEWGKKVSENKATARIPSVTRFRPFVGVSERPSTKQDLQTRANYEAMWRTSASISAEITVYGWLKPSGGLWKPGDEVNVKSPMLLLDMPLAIKSTTFTQAPPGSLTVLELVRKDGLVGRLDLGGVTGAAPSGGGATEAPAADVPGGAPAEPATQGDAPWG